MVKIDSQEKGLAEGVFWTFCISIYTNTISLLPNTFSSTETDPCGGIGSFHIIHFFNPFCRKFSSVIRCFYFFINKIFLYISKKRDSFYFFYNYNFYVVRFGKYGIQKSVLLKYNECQQWILNVILTCAWSTILTHRVFIRDPLKKIFQHSFFVNIYI